MTVPLPPQVLAETEVLAIKIVPGAAGEGVARKVRLRLVMVMGLPVELRNRSL